MNMGRKIKVLIVDASAPARHAFVSIFEAAPDIEVMGKASDPFVAAQRIQEEVPDVVILDVDMPRLDGITFLRKLMAQRPVPTILSSSLTASGSDRVIEALEAGAVDIILKPNLESRKSALESQTRIWDAVRAAASSRSRRTAVSHPSLIRENAIAGVMARALSPTRAMRPDDKIVCIGASTGGAQSLREVLMALPADCPGIVVVLHMPEVFTAAFARRLDTLCQVDVKEAEDGDEIVSGRVLIGPGNKHMSLRRNGARHHVVIKDGPPVSRHRPSVDVLFHSAARQLGSKAVGILMTGMGDDGARGLLDMKNAGATTIAQDEDTCVLFGMPKEAIALGAADTVLPLSAIPAEILSAWSHP